MVSYHEFESDLIEQALELYEKEGWDLYFGDVAKLRRAFNNSLYILGAFEETNLVGFTRCLGDGEFDVYVTDLIVAKEYRRKGIGRTLLSIAMKRFENVDTFALMTGINEESNNAFYKSVGMKEYREKGLIGYLR